MLSLSHSEIRITKNPVEMKQLSGRYGNETVQPARYQTIMRRMTHASGQHIKSNEAPRAHTRPVITSPLHGKLLANRGITTPRILPPTHSPSPSAYPRGVSPIKDAVPACHRLHPATGHSSREHHRCVSGQYSGKTISSPGHQTHDL